MQEEPQEFERLRKLLALKRHENPPPGYFDGFSRNVMQRLERGESSRLHLWQQIWTLFRTRPAISWSFSVAALMVLFVASSGVDPHASAPNPASMPAFGSPAGSPGPTTAFSTNGNAWRMGPRLTFESVSAAQTNVEPKLDSLFSTPFYHQVEPVSFSR